MMIIVFLNQSDIPSCQLKIHYHPPTCRLESSNHSLTCHLESPIYRGERSYSIHDYKISQSLCSFEMTDIEEFDCYFIFTIFFVSAN
jgi:hypothetical protein